MRLLSTDRMEEIQRIVESEPGVKGLPICEIESIVSDLFTWVSQKEREVDELSHQLDEAENEVYQLEEYYDSYVREHQDYQNIRQGLGDLHWSQVVGNHLQCAYCHERWPCATMQVTLE